MLVHRFEKQPTLVGREQPDQITMPRRKLDVTTLVGREQPDQITMPRRKLDVTTLVSPAYKPPPPPLYVTTLASPAYKPPPPRNKPKLPLLPAYKPPRPRQPRPLLPRAAMKRHFEHAPSSSPPKRKQPVIERTGRNEEEYVNDEYKWFFSKEAGDDVDRQFQYLLQPQDPNQSNNDDMHREPPPRPKRPK